jgi:hypothetical protein
LRALYTFLTFGDWQPGLCRLSAQRAASPGVT